MEWKDYGHPHKRQKIDGGIARNEKVTLATGSFDANVGIWEHNPSHSHSHSHSHNAHTSSSDDAIHDDDDMETDLTQQDRESDNEEWSFTTLLTGPDSEIKSIAFSPPHYSANLLATSSRDKSVWVWEEVEGEEWETVGVCAEHGGDVKCVAWCEGGRFPRGKRRKGDDGGGRVPGSFGVEDEEEEGEEEEERIVGSRELLASGSYDDTIRLWRDVEDEGDWMCVAVIEGHGGTVWDVCWEKYINTSLYPNLSNEDIAGEWEPRLISCSDDLSIRLWKKELSESEKEKKRNQRESNGMNGVGQIQRKLPSIIRPTSMFEKWVEDSVLPEVHVRSVYAVDWSRETGLVVSCGGDGTIAVYKEALQPDAEIASAQTGGGEDVVMNGTTEHDDQDTTRPKSKWIVVAIIEAAHDEYEINHVCWAARRDREKRFDGEEIIVSTGDDGDVRVWTLPEDVMNRLD